MTNQTDLRALHALCKHRSDTANGQAFGVTPDGQAVTATYRRNGNYDIAVAGVYLGTVWYS